MPSGHALSQNYPTPFNPQTSIAYQLPEASEVRLTVCNAAGQQVATLISAHQDAGHYELVWDAKETASGIYLVRMEAGDFVEVRKMVLMR